MLVAVELESFNLKAGQTLFQGRFQCCRPCLRLPKNRRRQGSLSQKHAGNCLSTQHACGYRPRKEADFRHEYVVVMATRIAQFFYAHDPYGEMGTDANAWR